MGSPLVSVIMPVYNASKYLPEAIEGILNQSFSDFEFIIIDDGSSDDSPKIIRKYVKRDKRIKVLTNKENRGSVKCRNMGLKLARGKYVAVEDADDVSLPNRLEVQVQYLEDNPQVVLLGTSYHIIDETGEILTTVEVPTKDKVLRRILLKNNPIDHGSIMFRRKEICRIGGYREEFVYAHDYDLILRALEIGEIHNLSSIHHKWRFRKESISAKKFALQTAFSRLARKLALERLNYGREISPLKPEPMRFQIDPEIQFQLRVCKMLVWGGKFKRARKEALVLMNNPAISSWIRIYLSALYLWTHMGKIAYPLQRKIISTLLNQGIIL